MDVSIIITFISFVMAYGKHVPPNACFKPFKWEDCGRPPSRVFYYYKAGSRCEVGTWRGCFPNQNMFNDEYECVNTCIYVERAQPEDFHQLKYSSKSPNGEDSEVTPSQLTSSRSSPGQSSPRNDVGTETIPVHVEVVTEESEKQTDITTEADDPTVYSTQTNQPVTGIGK